MSVFSLGRSRPSPRQCSALWKGCSVMQLLLPALHPLGTIQMFSKRHLCAPYFLLVLGRASSWVRCCDSLGAGAVSSAGLCCTGACAAQGLGELSWGTDSTDLAALPHVGCSCHTACLACCPRNFNKDFRAFPTFLNNDIYRAIVLHLCEETISGVLKTYLCGKLLGINEKLLRSPF